MTAIPAKKISFLVYHRGDFSLAGIAEGTLLLLDKQTLGLSLNNVKIFICGNGCSLEGLLAILELSR
ncbi:hypothetical protein NEOC84_000765|nr:hypothetical protein [Neochlamydia sp. AcF95]NGY94865.1 hypothetical protein [Neochlamydia sp. AcF84]